MDTPDAMSDDGLRAVVRVPINPRLAQSVQGHSRMALRQHEVWGEPTKQTYSYSCECEWSGDRHVPVLSRGWQHCPACGGWLKCEFVPTSAIIIPSGFAAN